MNRQPLETQKKTQKRDQKNRQKEGQKKDQKKDQAAWWQSLVGTALVGTDRQSPESLSDTTALGNVVNQLDWQQPEDALLKAAGIFSVYQQAGQQTGREHGAKGLGVGKSEAKKSTEKELTEKEPTDAEEGPPTPEPAQPDIEQCCSARICAHLKTGLEQYPQAVEELLGLIADLGQRVSPPLLPALLRYGEQSVASQPAVEAVLGNRGRWLAAQNPAWHYVRQGVETTVSDAFVSDTSASNISISERDIIRWQSHWRSGTKKQRMAAITKWRQVDPDGAREVIADSWTSEDWRTRENVVCTFNANLTMADEPFLETALGDRAAGVRQSAAACLAQLPESRLCQRMAERIQKFVHIKATKDGLTLEVSLPETFDSHWKQDGIQQTSVHQLSDQASWVAQMLAKAPLSYWNSKFDQIQEILDRSSTSHSSTSHSSTSGLSISQRDRLIVLSGWSQAACNQRATQLAKAWVSLLLSQQDFQAWEQALLRDMLSILSPEKKEQYLRAQVPVRNNDQASSHWLQLVAESQQRWDYDFSRLVLSQLTQVMQGKRKYGDLFSPPAEIALFLHPGLAPEAERMIENWTQSHRPTKAWQRFLDEFLGVLTYRWRMYQLLAESR